MKTAKTLTEIKLMRRNLQHELRFVEDKIKLHSGELVSDYKRMLIGTAMQQGALILLKIMSKKIVRRFTR